MELFINKYSSLLNDKTGIKSILFEMGTQMNDAKETYQQEESVITEFAYSIKKTGRIILLGMGASHFANKIFSFQLRKMGFFALALTASEFLYDPIPLTDEIVLLTSQSGESIETIKCLKYLDKMNVYGITLSRESIIGKKTRSIIASGGMEKAYAGTRSVTLTLAIMAYVSAKLGAFPIERITEAMDFVQQKLPEMEKAVKILHAKQSLVVTGRSLFSGLSHLFALGCQELSGKANLCNETGQLRHGPLEVLSSESALVVFRQSGELGTLAESFVAVKKKTGCALIVIDSSESTPLEGAVTIKCPIGNDIAATLAVMDTFQSLMISYACGKNDYTGIPKYSSKITKKE